MRKIPPKLLNDILADPDYQVCMRKRLFGDHMCGGRITLEHALIYAGRQVNEKFAIIALCAKAHSVDEWQDGGILNKEKNKLTALLRASEDDLDRYSRGGWDKELEYLYNKYKTEIVGLST